MQPKTIPVTKERLRASDDPLDKAIRFFRDQYSYAYNKREESEEIELEVRLGVSKIIRNADDNEPGTNEKYWSNVYRYCKTLPDTRRLYSRIHDRQADLKVKIPGVKYRQRSYNEGQGVWQIKKVIDKEDIPDYWVRIALSSETLTHEPVTYRAGPKIANPKDEVTVTSRYISRHTFIHRNARIDLSKTNTNNVFTNEIEVEYIRDTPYGIDVFITIIRNLIQAMHDSPVFFSFSQLEAVSLLANTYLDPSKQRHRVNLDRSYFTEARNLSVAMVNYGGLFKRSVRMDDEPQHKGKRPPPKKAIKPAGERDWYITLKIDGERCILVVCNLGTWIIFPPHRSQLISLTPEHAEAGVTIIDCELSGKNLFFLHALIVDSDDYRKRNFREGYTSAMFWRNQSRNRRLLSDDYNLYFKPFVPVRADEFFSRAREMVTQSSLLAVSIEGETDPIGAKCDGFILIPTDVDYLSLVTHPETYKWKPEFTVDLRVYIDDGVVKLFSSDVTIEGGLRKMIDVPFVGEPSAPWTGGIDLSAVAVNPGSVVEFKWENEKLVAIRTREDKTGANSPYAARSNWLQMTQDNLRLDAPTLLCENNILAKKYHNRIKTGLITSVVGSRRDLVLLDIGSGRLADAEKWLIKGGKQGKSRYPAFSHIFAVEPNEDNIDEAKKRLQAYPELRGIVHLIEAKGQDTEKIAAVMREHIGDRQADVVTMMDSLTFFFNPDDSDLRQLAATIHRCLKPGGTFIWKMFDGDKVRAAFASQNSDVLRYGKDTYIERLTEDKVRVYVLPFVDKQEEWLSSVDRLRKTLRLTGVESTANTEPLLTREYGNFSELYSYGIFQLENANSNIPLEVREVFNTSTIIQGPYGSYASLIEAVEALFTTTSRSIITAAYAKLARLPTPHHRSPLATPITYFEAADNGFLIPRFLVGQSVDAIVADITEDVSFSIISMLGLDVYLVDRNEELLSTNALEGSINPSVVIQLSNGYYTPIVFGREVCIPADSEVLADYERAPIIPFEEWYTEALNEEAVIEALETDTSYTADCNVIDHLLSLKGDLLEEETYQRLSKVTTNK